MFDLQAGVPSTTDIYDRFHLDKGNSGNAARLNKVSISQTAQGNTKSASVSVPADKPASKAPTGKGLILDSTQQGNIQAPAIKDIGNQSSQLIAIFFNPGQLQNHYLKEAKKTGPFEEPLVNKVLSQNQAIKAYNLQLPAASTSNPASPPAGKDLSPAAGSDATAPSQATPGASGTVDYGEADNTITADFAIQQDLTLDGNTGTDTLKFTHALARYQIQYYAATGDSQEHFVIADNSTDYSPLVANNFESFQFNSATYTKDQLIASIH